MSNLKPIQHIRPFTKFCMTIGNLPSSYLVSLTYEEQLLWLCNYLQNTIIPTVNNNGEAVTELQNLYNELKSYVDNYFTNLDVQNEINTKLDEMATDGTLENIINQEIFENINNSLTNLENTNLSKKYYFDPSQPTIFIGDSYGGGYTSDGIVTSYQELLIQRLNINSYYRFNRGGAGFANTDYNEETTQGGTFLKLLKDKISKITDKNAIKNIVVCGGYNDRDFTSSNQIVNAISSFVTYCHQQMPNAQIFIGQIGWNSGIISRLIRSNLEKVTNQYMTGASQNGCIYLQNSENILKNSDLMTSDYVHPNANGHIELANYLLQALISGYCTIRRRLVHTITPTTIYENGSLSTNIAMIETTENNLCLLYMPNITINWETPITISNPLTSFELCNPIDFKTLLIENQNNNLTLNTNYAQVTFSDNTIKLLDCRAFINNDGGLSIQLISYNENGTVKPLENIKKLIVVFNSETYPLFRY